MFDLHLHSDASDGKADLGALLAACAARPQLRRIALADHDHIASSVAFAAAEPRAIVAIELTTSAGQAALHLLALGIDPADAALTGYLETRRTERRERLTAWGERLRALGLTFELDPAVADGSSFGKPHIVDELRRHATNEVLLPAAPADPRVSDPIYELYLKVGGLADVSKIVPGRLIGLPEAITLVHGAGGLAILAHPLVSVYLAGQKRSEAAWRLGASKAAAKIAGWAADGLDGLEVFAHGQEDEDFQNTLLALTAEHGLLVSAGSDDHSAELEYLGTALAHDDPRAAGWLAALEGRLAARAT